jgi:hypothetical protein
MVFTRKILEFYKLNTGDIKAFILSHLHDPDDDKIKEITQSFYLNLLVSNSLVKYDPTMGMSFSSYIYNVLVWTMGRNYYLISPEPGADIDVLEEVIPGKDNESIQYLVDDYIKWVTKKYPERLSKVVKYLDKRLKKGLPTMKSPGYVLHVKTYQEYNDL